MKIQVGLAASSPSLAGQLLYEGEHQIDVRPLASAPDYAWQRFARRDLSRIARQQVQGCSFLANPTGPPPANEDNLMLPIMTLLKK